MVKAGVHVGNPLVENADKSQNLNLMTAKKNKKKSSFVVSKCCFLSMTYISIFFNKAYLRPPHAFLLAIALAPIPLKHASVKNTLV